MSRLKWRSAASRRLLKMAGVDRIDEAVPRVVSRVLAGIHCPPTDLGALCARLNVVEVLDDDDIPVVGELRRKNGVFQILCAGGQSAVRRRFTIAHELAHVLFESTGPGAPRVGADLERLCDMIAAEILMPSTVFRAAFTQTVVNGAVVRLLAGTFETSLTATVLRCSEFRPLSVVCVHQGRKKWSRGRARPTDYQLGQLLRHFVDGEPGDDLVAIERAGSAEIYRGEWLRTTAERSGLVLLTPVSKSLSGGVSGA